MHWHGWAFSECSLGPSGYDETTTEVWEGEMRVVFGHYPGPLVQYLAPEEIMLLLVPVALTGCALVLVCSQTAPSAWIGLTRWGLGLLCLGFCAVPVWFIKEVDVGFIGWLFLPAALVLIASAIAGSVMRSTRARY